MSNSGQPWRTQCSSPYQPSPHQRPRRSIRVGCSPDAVAEVLQGNSSEMWALQIDRLHISHVFNLWSLKKDEWFSLPGSSSYYQQEVALLSLEICSRSMSLEGLAEALANHDAFRSKILTDDSLISWQSAKLKGVCKNKDAQRLNMDLLMLVGDLWCPQWTSATMIPLCQAKDEALIVLKPHPNQASSPDLSSD